MRKGPGIHIDRAEVTMTLAEAPEAGDYERVWTELEAQTGYKLVVSGG